MDAETIACFHGSLDRCLGVGSFLERFYARFLASDEAVASRFRGTDMRRQESVLRASLYLVLRAAQGGDDGRAHLVEVAHSHSHRGHDIPPRLYDLWMDALLSVAAECDPRWGTDTERAWVACVRPFIEGMQAAYQPPS